MEQFVIHSLSNLFDSNQTFTVGKSSKPTPHYGALSELNFVVFTSAIDNSIHLAAKLLSVHGRPDIGAFLGKVDIDRSGRCDASLHPSASNNPSNSARPSVPPSSGSTTRSGCGIRPSTLRFSLRMPAIFRALPLGLSPSA